MKTSSRDFPVLAMVQKMPLRAPREQVHMADAGNGLIGSRAKRTTKLLPQAEASRVRLLLVTPTRAARSAQSGCPFPVVFRRWGYGGKFGRAPERLRLWRANTRPVSAGMPAPLLEPFLRTAASCQPGAPH